MTHSIKKPNPTLFTSLIALALGAATGACSLRPDADPPATDVKAQETTLRELQNAPITEAPVPSATGENPLIGAQLFVDPTSLAMLTANSLRDEKPAEAALLDRIASEPQALWMGNWNSDIYRSVDHFTSRAVAEGAVPVMIAYNIPHRDCDQYSGGGSADKEAYQRWIRAVHAGIGERPAVVILEPDALGHFQECLSDEQKAERMALLNDAVRVLRQNPKTAVYLDAGHARWVKAPDMAERLKEAGVEHAHGFSLNVSNYVSTEENLEYGRALSELTGGKGFVIDTSRVPVAEAPGRVRRRMQRRPPSWRVLARDGSQHGAVSEAVVSVAGAPMRRPRGDAQVRSPGGGDPKI